MDHEFERRHAKGKGRRGAGCSCCEGFSQSLDLLPADRAWLRSLSFAALGRL